MTSDALQPMKKTCQMVRRKGTGWLQATLTPREGFVVAMRELRHHHRSPPSRPSGPRRPGVCVLITRGLAGSSFQGCRPSRRRHPVPGLESRFSRWSPGRSGTILMLCCLSVMSTELFSRYFSHSSPQILPSTVVTIQREPTCN